MYRFIALTLLFLTIFIGKVNIFAVEYKLPKGFHHYLAVELNTKTWKLLEENNRNKADEQRMVAFAHGSQYHWYKSANWKPINAQRGEWLLSHVYAVLKDAGKALEHAKKCLKKTKQLNLKGYDLAYAYEAMARAYAVSGNKMQYKKWYDLAEKYGNKIESETDRNYFFKDLKKGPWLTNEKEGKKE